MREETSGEWLRRALREVRGNITTGLDLDDDVISGLVAYCEMAAPEDAQEYLNNIVGQEAGERVIAEYMRRRGYSVQSDAASSIQSSNLQVYMKQPAELSSNVGSKKQGRTHQKENLVIQNSKKTTETAGVKIENKATSGSSRKKTGKAVSLADAAKGSVVFQQGKPCSCQAHRHRLVGNCLSCGKIVCEQEGEGPCSFCGALVLKEGSSYAGLEDSLLPQSASEVAAEAFAKRLVGYDRDSAARTSVIDDQSDYYEIEGNSWLSAEEKELLRKKQQETEEADRARRNKVVVTFDLVGRKVLMHQDDAQEIEAENRILRPQGERELNRIKPNPTAPFQPFFVDQETQRNLTRVKPSWLRHEGFCLEISGRVQHDNNDFQLSEGSQENGDKWKGQLLNKGSCSIRDDDDCYLDYH